MDTMPITIRAAIYARKSTSQDDVADEAKSVTRQIDAATNSSRPKAGPSTPRTSTPMTECRARAPHATGDRSWRSRLSLSALRSLRSTIFFVIRGLYHELDCLDLARFEAERNPAVVDRQRFLTLF
jgi:hypothetical protein